MDSITDEQLVTQYLANKNNQALEQLVKRYLPLIFGYVKKFTGNQENASDISQEVFVKVWKNLQRFDTSKSFRTWIFTIAKRTAIDELRKKNALPFSVLSEDGDFSESLADESVSIFDQLSSKQTSQKLAFAIAKLPTGYRSVLKMRVNEGLNFREIATKSKEPLNTIKSRYRRGVALLKKVL